MAYCFQTHFCLHEWRREQSISTMPRVKWLRCSGGWILMKWALLGIWDVVMWNVVYCLNFWSANMWVCLKLWENNQNLTIKYTELIVSLNITIHLRLFNCSHLFCAHNMSFNRHFPIFSCLMKLSSNCHQIELYSWPSLWYMKKKTHGFPKPETTIYRSDPAPWGGLLDWPRQETPGSVSSELNQVAGSSCFRHPRNMVGLWWKIPSKRLIWV